MNETWSAPRLVRDGIRINRGLQVGLSEDEQDRQRRDALLSASLSTPTGLTFRMVAASTAVSRDAFLSLTDEWVRLRSALRSGDASGRFGPLLMRTRR